MPMRTKPDATQPEVIAGFESAGGTVFEFQDLPYWDPLRFANFPDIGVLFPYGATLVGDADYRDLVQVLEPLLSRGDVKIIRGGMFLCEVKTEIGKLSQGQKNWWNIHYPTQGPLVARTYEEARRLAGGRLD